MAAVTAIDYEEAVDAFAEKLREIRANMLEILAEPEEGIETIDRFLELRPRLNDDDVVGSAELQDAIWREMWGIVAEHGMGWWA